VTPDGDGKPDPDRVAALIRIAAKRLS